MRSPQHYDTGIFSSSSCPEPGALTFVAFTMLPISWVFYQLCLPSSSSPAYPQLRGKNESHTTQPRSNTRRVVVSLLYAVICGILLLDGCWLGSIYTWGIKQTYRGTARGIADFAFTVLVLAVLPIFLLVGFALWFWALSATARRLWRLWAYSEEAFEEDELTGISKNAESE
ncbi:hypothetical protein GGS24DRAFT_107944 [Hypoxylon argillaceum]|nr:hypothetical protein GGS24DRAFT_107944 [Hypoxylon argillaceum]